MNLNIHVELFCDLTHALAKTRFSPRREMQVATLGRKGMSRGQADAL
jgi:hypothetical protein